MKPLIPIIIFSFIAIDILAPNAQAFPDTIRHGYTNCTTCHLSPSGGGLLTPYGRSLSRELISTWGYENEELPLHGLVKIPENLSETIYFGGDVRALSISERKQEEKNGATEIENESESFLMQSQLRFAYGMNQLKLILSAGKIENPKEEKNIKWVSPEYYALWSPKEEVFARAGRFEPLYGLRMPDHNLWIKSEIGLVPWAERDTLEMIYEGEKQFLSVSGFQSTSASASQHTTGYTGSIFQMMGDKHRVGLSGMNQEGQGLRLRTLSLIGTFTLSEHTYILTENTRLSALEKTKDISFIRFGYEIFKGFTLTLQNQFKQELSKSNTAENKSGFGAIWFPRPHFEIVTSFDQHKKKNEKEDELTLLFHYYL